MKRIFLFIALLLGIWQNVVFSQPPTQPVRYKIVRQTYQGDTLTTTIGDTIVLEGSGPIKIVGLILDTSKIIYSVGGNNVMGQPLVVNDTLKSNVTLYNLDSLSVSNNKGEMLYIFKDIYPGGFDNTFLISKSSFVIRTENLLSGQTKGLSIATGGSNDSNSGILDLSTGASEVNSGDIYLSSGASANGNSGNILIQNGAANNGVKGHVKISTDSLVIDGIPSATTTNIMYYNTTTKEVTYGESAKKDTTYIYSQINKKADTSSINDLSNRVLNDSLLLVNLTGRYEADSLLKNTAINGKQEITDTSTYDATKHYVDSSIVSIPTTPTIDYSSLLLNNTPSDTNNISAAQGINSARLIQTVLIIQGNGGAVDISADPQIADATVGDIIELWGNNNTNTVKIDDGTGVQLNGGVSFTIGAGDVLKLRYMTVGGVTDWFEISRSDN